MVKIKSAFYPLAYVTPLISDAVRVLQRRPWKLERPRVLQFPVNDICNARCQMCGIWARKKEHEITPSELDGILFDPLWKRVRVVGLNGGEPTLRKDLAALAEVLHNRLHRLRRVSLITNALVADKAISRINELLEISSRHRTELDVMVSLDGVGEVHDRVRGRPGNFKKALEVLNHISAIGSPVTARIGCTVIRDNVYGLHDLHEFALEKKIYIKYRLGVPHNRLYNKNHLSPFALNDDERLHFAEFLRHIVTFYEPSERQKFFYRSLIGQFHDGKQRCAGCDWQHRGATLSSRGELLYCAVESPVLGSALDEGASALYFGSKQTLRKILQDACGGCAHDYVGLPSARQYCKEVAAAIASQSSIGLNLNAPKIFAYPARTTRFLQTLRRGRAIKSKEAKKAILLCGWYGTETVGDKAILAGVTEALRGIYGQIPMRVASLDPPLTKVTLKQVPDLQSHEVISIQEAVATASSAEMLVFAGGPIMGVRALADIEAIFERAASRGVPCIIAGCGFGPLESGIHKRSARRILALCKAMVWRDEQSLAYAQKLLGREMNALVAEDPAFTWLSRLVPPGHKRDRSIVLGLRDWPSHQYASALGARAAKRLQRQSEAAILDALMAAIERDSSLSLLPLPMCTNHAGGDDRWYLRELLRRQPSLLERVDQAFLTQEVAPEVVAHAVWTANAAIAMRYHALVFAIGTGTPAVALDYTLGKGKVAALARRFDIPVSAFTDVSVEWLHDQLSKALTGDSVRPNPLTPTFKAVLRELLDAS